MKIEIVYFSGTGNTWWVVEKLKGALEEKGHEVRMVAYESKERNHLPTENAELFGIAFPTYGHGAPPNMEDYASKLNTRKGLKCFVLTTAWMHWGMTAINYAKILKKRGMEPVLAAGVKMPMNTFCPIMPMLAKWMPTPEDKIPEIKKKALEYIKAIADALDEDKKILKPDHSLCLSSKLEYNFLRKFVLPRIRLKVTSACTRCGKCIEWCPTQNIIMTNEVVKFNSRCILCARCWTFCPENAISIPFGPKRSYIGIDEGYRPPKVESV